MIIQKDNEGRKETLQWMNLHQKNSFIDWMQLPLLCEKSGVIFLVLVSLTAGAGTPIKQITGRFEN